MLEYRLHIRSHANLIQNLRFDVYQLWYQLSKTMAEESAVTFAQENGLKLVVINPGYVIGPMLQPTLNFTSEGIMSLIKYGILITNLPLMCT